MSSFRSAPGAVRIVDDARVVNNVERNSAHRGPARLHTFGRSMAGKLVVTANTPRGCIEQYRRLAATLHHAQTATHIKVVMVASALAGEGKTLTATNLALTFSESYHRRVLLVDADLRRPTVHEVFELPNLTGLNDGLTASVEWTPPLFEVSSRLTVLTAGRPNHDPMSGLASDRLGRLIREAATAFEWIVVDTPPVGLLPDANLLATIADVVVFVIAAGSTPYKVLQRAVETLGRERIIGVVLNRADGRSVRTGYGYYDYYGGDTAGR